MTYCAISNWTATEWTDEMEALARDKYVPMVLAVGASSVKMIRTGDLSFTIVTEYADAAAADAARARIAEIRATAAGEMPMTMSDTGGGEIFAQG